MNKIKAFFVKHKNIFKDIFKVLYYVFIFSVIEWLLMVSISVGVFIGKGIYDLYGDEIKDVIYESVGDSFYE